VSKQEGIQLSLQNKDEDNQAKQEGSQKAAELTGGEGHYLRVHCSQLTYFLYKKW